MKGKSVDTKERIGMSKKDKVTLDLEKGEITAFLGGLEKRVIIMTPKSFVDAMKVLHQAFKTAAFTMFHMMGKEKGWYEAKREVQRKLIQK